MTSILLSIFMLLTLFILPAVLLASLLSINFITSTFWIYAFGIFIILFALTTALIAQFGRSQIKPGKIKQGFFQQIFGGRVYYRIAWNLLFYFKPLYMICLKVPFLKKLTFRIFGYQDHLNFLLSSHAQISDLALLKMGERALIQNEAQLQNSLALFDQHLWLDHITLENHSILSQGSIVSPGVYVGEYAWLDKHTLIGLKSKIGKKAKIEHHSQIHHGSHVDDQVNIGPYSFVGTRVHIGKNITLKPGSHIPSQSQIQNQLDVLKLEQLEKERLKNTFSESMSKMKKHFNFKIA